LEKAAKERAKLAAQFAEVEEAEMELFARKMRLRKQLAQHDARQKEIWDRELAAIVELEALEQSAHSHPSGESSNAHFDISTGQIREGANVGIGVVSPSLSWFDGFSASSDSWLLGVSGAPGDTAVSGPALPPSSGV